MNRDFCGPLLGRLVLDLIASIGQTQSQLLSNVVGLCFWKGAWSLLRTLEVHCVPHGGKGWLSTCRCHYFSSVGWLPLNAKFMH